MGYIGPNAAAGAIIAAGTDWDAVTMTAIAGAESGWNTTAVSVTNDYGLMQINHDAWPELFSRYQWDDAGQNAQMGHHVWLQQGYRAWTTYTSGAYRQYLGQAQAAVGQPATAPQAPPGADVQQTEGDWSGWDFSPRIDMTASNLFQALVHMNGFGGAIKSIFLT